MNLTRYLSLLVILLAGGYQTLAQTISSFDPMFGSPGETVIIYGGDFYPGILTVSFNGVVDTTARATSPGVIYARVPATATTGPITVKVNATSVSSAFMFTVIGPGPFITGFYPEFGAANDPITITGAHLTNPGGTAPVVKFGGVPSTSVAANSAGTQLTARVPAKATNGVITVTTTLGTTNSLRALTVIGPEPYVTGFSPHAGNAGTRIQIDGVHFPNVTNVLIGGQRGLNLWVQSETRIEVDVPPGVATGPLVVSSREGSYTTSELFYAPPGVSAFAPASGRAGTNVVIRGTNLLGAVAVWFSGVPATFIAPTNNTNLIATVPADALSGPVMVSAPAGSSTTKTNFRVEPSISGFTPFAGTNGAAVTVSGANLQQGFTALSFGAVTAQVANVSYSQLTAKVPASAVTGPLTITTTNGLFTTTSNFFVPALITNMTPIGGPPGTVVAISGRNFLGTTNVTFGTSAVFVVADNWKIHAVVPDGALSGQVSITTPAGTVLSTNAFFAPPVIRDFSPAQGRPGTNVVISGTNLLGATLVSFGGVRPQFNVVNNNEVRAVVPSGAKSGPITVGTPGGTNSSAASFQLALVADLALTGSAAPIPATVGADLVYTLRVTSAGPDMEPAARVSVSGVEIDTLQQLTFSAGSVATNAGTLAWSIGEMATNASATATIVVRPRAQGMLALNASAGGDFVDPNLANNSVALLTQVLPAPELRIEHKAAMVFELFWPASFTNYQLEFTPVLSNSAPWSNVTVGPVPSGSEQKVRVTNSSGSSFYRLRR